MLTRDGATADGNPGLVSPYSVSRKVRYTYSEPAYDRWQRKLAGFRKVSAQVGDEAAITELAAAPTFRSWVGRPVRVDRHISANPGGDRPRVVQLSEAAFGTMLAS